MQRDRPRIVDGLRLGQQPARIGHRRASAAARGPERGRRGAKEGQRGLRAGCGEGLRRHEGRPKAHLRRGSSTWVRRCSVYAASKSKLSCPVGSRAGARGGGSVGRPRWDRILCTVAGSVMVAWAAPPCRPSASSASCAGRRHPEASASRARATKSGHRRHARTLAVVAHEGEVRWGHQNREAGQELHRRHDAMGAPAARRLHQVGDAAVLQHLDALEVRWLLAVTSKRGSLDSPGTERRAVAPPGLETRRASRRRSLARTRTRLGHAARPSPRGRRCYFGLPRRLPGRCHARKKDEGPEFAAPSPRSFADGRGSTLGGVAQVQRVRPPFGKGPDGLRSPDLLCPLAVRSALLPVPTV